MGDQGKMRAKKVRKSYYLSWILNKRLVKYCKKRNISQTDFIESLLSKSLRAN